MSTLPNARSYQNPRNVNLQGQGVGRGGLLRFTGTNAANPFGAVANGLYVNSSNQLVYVAQNVSTVLGSGGGGGTPSWETLFAADATFTMTPDTAFTIAGNRSTATDVLVLTNIGGGSGQVLQITNSGTGKDIQGTSSTWNVTKAGVATFAGVSISGSTTAFATTGVAVWTIKDNDSAALTISASGATGILSIDSTDGAELVKFGKSAQVTDGNLTLISTSNTVTNLLITNNSATTFGANANSSGVVVIRSTSLTTGALLQLQVTEGTLAGGFFIVGRHVTAGSNVYTVGENGATVIAGLGGSDMLTVTAGDVVFSDASITMTDADNAATLSVTNNTATSASVFVFAGSGVFTGTTTTSFFTITPSGLTTGTAVYIAAVGATTSVGVVDVAVAGLTSGSALRITAATANFTTGGKLIELTSTAAVAGNLLTATTTGAYTGTGMVLVTAGALTTGIVLSLISTTGLTSGSVIRATTSTAGAIATNGAFSFTATGNFTSGAATLGAFHVAATATAAGTIMDVTGGALTTGVALYVADSGTGMTSGSLIRVATGTTGAVATNGIVSIRATGAYTSTSNSGLLDVQASAITGAATLVNLQSTAASQTAVTILNIVQSGATLTAYTGTMVAMTGGFSGASSTGAIVGITAVNDVAGDALKITNNALTLGAGTLINLVHGTSVIGAGSSMLRLTSTGVDTGTTTGTMLDIAATAATTAHLAIITSATLTTGVGMKMVLNGLTSGNGLLITSSSTDATARGLIQLTNSGSGSTGTALIRGTQVVQSTNFRRILTESGSGVTLWYGNGTTGQGNLSGTVGDILFNGGSNKPEYCTGTTNWTALV